MTVTNPNRDKKQSGSDVEKLRKQSGDQHVLPLEDTDEAPHRPHRFNREDMQKLEPGNPGRDVSGTP